MDKRKLLAFLIVAVVGALIVMMTFGLWIFDSSSDTSPTDDPQSGDGPSTSSSNANSEPEPNEDSNQTSGETGVGVYDEAANFLENESVEELMDDREEYVGRSPVGGTNENVGVYFEISENFRYPPSIIGDIDPSLDTDLLVQQTESVIQEDDFVITSGAGGSPFAGMVYKHSGWYDVDKQVGVKEREVFLTDELGETRHEHHYTTGSEGYVRTMTLDEDTNQTASPFTPEELLRLDFLEDLIRTGYYVPTNYTVIRGHTYTVVDSRFFSESKADPLLDRLNARSIDEYGGKLHLDENGALTQANLAIEYTDQTGDAKFYRLELAIGYDKFEGSLPDWVRPNEFNDGEGYVDFVDNRYLEVDPGQPLSSEGEIILDIDGQRTTLSTPEVASGELIYIWDAGNEIRVGTEQPDPRITLGVDYDVTILDAEDALVISS